jgi:Uma2 family endonuclease
MSLQLKKNVTLDEFQTFVERLENSDKRFELIDGEIVEVPSNTLAAIITARIVGFFFMFLQQNKVKGHVSGPDGGFLINDHIFAPDVAYVRHLPDGKGYEQRPPLLIVEVISDPTRNAEQTDLRRKLVQYRAAGVTTWVVDYLARLVEVHSPDGTMQIYDDTTTLTGGDILPGFELPVKDIFPQDDENETE